MEFIDNKTGLIWQRCIGNKRWDTNFNECRGEARVQRSGESLLDGKNTKENKNWRIPTAVELSNLIKQSSSDELIKIDNSYRGLNGNIECSGYYFITASTKRNEEEDRIKESLYGKNNFEDRTKIRPIDRLYVSCKDGGVSYLPSAVVFLSYRFVRENVKTNPNEFYPALTPLKPRADCRDCILEIPLPALTKEADDVENTLRTITKAIILNKNINGISDIKSINIPMFTASISCKNINTFINNKSTNLIIKSRLVSLFSNDPDIRIKENARFRNIINSTRRAGNFDVYPEGIFENDIMTLAEQLQTNIDYQECGGYNGLKSIRDEFAKRRNGMNFTKLLIMLDFLEKQKDVIEKHRADQLPMIKAELDANALKIENAYKEAQARDAKEAQAQAVAKAKSDVAVKIIQEKIQNCQRTNPAYAYYIATSGVANSVVNAQSLVRMFERAIAKEKEGAAISGYVDKKIMYESGQNLVRYIPQRDAAFRAYKNAGGRASSPAEVTNIPNPCAIFE